MTQDNTTARQAVQNSFAALKRGDKRRARAWAERAAVLAPNLEEPWLLLAAVSEPQTAIEYLQRALQVNPLSQRAKAGLQRMRVQLVEDTQPVWTVGDTQPTKVDKLPPPPPATGRPRRMLWLTGVLAAALLLTTGLGVASPALAALGNGSQPPVLDAAQGNSWGQVEIVKPTYTPTATPTFTSTPVATFTPSPTSTPEITATPAVVLVEPVEYVEPQAPEAPSYTGNKYILVDISEQHMYVYEGDVLVYSFVASTGMNNATRAGMFSVLNKIDNAYGATWNIWMPNWLGIYWAGSLQNGIHALPILSNGARLWAGYLGTPISYGCVVLGVYEAQTLYDWAEVGTPVEIQW
jgi:lipoprotein-anchoring transpeptidase ErfK/SrfK